MVPGCRSGIRWLVVKPEKGLGFGFSPQIWLLVAGSVAGKGNQLECEAVWGRRVSRRFFRLAVSIFRNGPWTRLLSRV